MEATTTCTGAAQAVLTMDMIHRAAREFERATQVADCYVAMVHPTIERAICRAWAAENGSPIRKHRRAAGRRSARRLRLKDWRPNHLARDAFGVTRIITETVG